MIDPSGIIVTNRHVIEGARDIIVGFQDGRRAMGKLLASGGEADIALLKISADKPLPVLKFGDSDSLRVGDPVLVIGNPLGIGISVSSGIVSALNRDIKDGPYDDFIQTDAALNHGNSGGPLVNTAGEVVGVNTALYSDISNGGSIGLGFAITAKDTQFIVDRLLRYGQVRAGWLGAVLQDVTPIIAEAMSLPSSDGAIVDRIDAGTPASKVGLREGDVAVEARRPGAGRRARFHAGARAHGGRRDRQPDDLARRAPADRSGRAVGMARRHEGDPDAGDQPAGRPRPQAFRGDGLVAAPIRHPGRLAGRGGDRDRTGTGHRRTHPGSRAT